MFILLWRFKLINRQDWLDTHGFIRDPFMFDALHAESDSLLLGDSWVEAYVDPRDAGLLYGDLVGDYYIPGSRFIFSKSGGGKSSIRKKIQFESQPMDLFVNKPKALVIDYVDHNYSLKESSIWHHIDRIFSIAISGPELSPANLNKKKLLDTRSPKTALKHFVAVCEDLGFKGIYILVDSLDIQAFEKILPLALNTELNKIKGLVIKFFISENLFFLGQQILPFREFRPYILRWQEDELSKLLSQRLSLCSESDLRIRTPLPGISYLCNFSLSGAVQNYFIEIGKLFGPGAMWEFGYYLLEEQTKFADQSTDLIGDLAFANARLRMSDSILKRDMPIDYNLIIYFQKKYKDILKTFTVQKSKAKLFLSCIPEDQDAVYELLFKPLESENYKPMMAQLNTSPGENWRNAITRMVEETEFFIPCYSANTLQSADIFHYALRLAKDRQQNYPDDWIYIIPALIDKCTIADNEIKKLRPLYLGEEEYFLLLLKALDKGIKLERRKK